MTEEVEGIFSGDTPIYLQLANLITRQVQIGELSPNQALPSERAMSEEYGVSRITVRKAIDNLAERKIIMRKHGSGNYVLPLLAQPLNKLRSFSEEIENIGQRPSSVWLTRSLTAPSGDEQKTLGLEIGARVARLERKRLSDNQVIAYEISVLPEDVVPSPEEINASLYGYLNAHRCAPVRATQHIKAINASASLAKLLEVKEGHALVYVRRLGYLEDGRLVEITITYGKCEHYDFVVELNR